MSLLFVHAVPVFLVLFGTNSEAWFSHRAPEGRITTWYERGFKRILVPTWATLVVWWLLVLVLRPEIVRVTISLPFFHALGYLKQVGTGWFITVILQLVLLFPLFHWLARRLGVRVLLAIGAGHDRRRAALRPADPRRARPRRVDGALAPLLRARRVRHAARAARRTGCNGATCSALSPPTSCSPCVQEKMPVRQAGRIANRLLELPLTVLLLAAMPFVARIPTLETALSWLGRHSLGLYLGQLLTHNAFLFAFGGVCTIFGCEGGVFAYFNLWLYTVILAAGSLLFLAAGHVALRLAASLRAGGLRHAGPVDVSTAA